MQVSAERIKFRKVVFCISNHGQHHYGAIDVTAATLTGLLYSAMPRLPAELDVHGDE